MVDRAQPDKEMLRLMNMGFHGFVEHSKVAESLPDAVHGLANGQLWFSDELTRVYIRLTEAQYSASDRSQLPTPRESEILDLVRQHLSNKDIATILGLAESTVKYHLSHIMAKYRVGSRRELETNTTVGPSRIWEQLSNS